MFGHLRNRRVIGESREVKIHRRPRALPENVFMWGESFWAPWREQASELAQTRFDNYLKELRRNVNCVDVRFFRRGNRLTIDAGTRGLQLDLIYADDQILDVTAVVKRVPCTK